MAAAKVMRQTWGSKDNLGRDNVQLRPDTHLPSKCNKWLWHIKRSEERNKGNKKMTWLSPQGCTEGGKSGAHGLKNSSSTNNLIRFLTKNAHKLL